MFEKSGKAIPIISGISFAVAMVMILLGYLPKSGVPLLLSFIGMAVYGYFNPKYKKMGFTFWVFAFLIAAMYYPFLFTDWGFNTGILVIPMLQLIMFGMGTKLSLSDFGHELRTPKGIIAGFIMAFTFMPIMAVLVAKLFALPPEIAVGLILIGSCPGGAASNVMAYLAKGNIALSISVTTITTLLTPVVTPLLMKLFASQLIEISFTSMMLSSFNLIIVPITAGLISNKILYGKAMWLQNGRNIIGLTLLFLLLSVVCIFTKFPDSLAVLKPGLILGFTLMALVSFTKLIVKWLRGDENWMDKILPSVSMVSILLFVTIVVALNRDKLLEVGLILVAASVVLNGFGFVLGYWGSRAVGLSKRDSRTLSIEVALKNGGLGMGLAIDALSNANAALAPIVFGKWMNISGSAIANYWRDRPTEGEIDNVALQKETQKL
ncbi:bile acid:sodium symporter family protein [Pricia sp.]|uniref:bile acid:sodium symporter family protein n=1 Tax=Pricia sp. TaxID=2268138 RepID=UPI0035937B37